MHRILPFLVALLLLVPGALWPQTVSRPRGGTGGGGGGGVTDGDKGDVTVSGSGSTWAVDSGAVNFNELAGTATDSQIPNNITVNEAFCLDRDKDGNCEVEGDGSSLLFDSNDDGVDECELDEFGTFTCADQESTGDNAIVVLDHDTDVTPDPTCANKGTAGALTILDVNEATVDEWVVCSGTSELVNFTDLEPTAHECDADPDCYWLTDGDADGDHTAELQTIANAIGSGSKPANRWRILSDPTETVKITSRVRLCHDTDATGATMPDCDGDGSLFGGEVLELGLSYVCAVKYSDRSALREPLTDACLWIGDAGDGSGTTDGFGPQPLTVTGFANLENWTSTDALLEGSEVRVAALLVERRITWDAALTVVSGETADLESTGVNDPGCSFGCSPPEGVILLGTSGHLKLTATDRDGSGGLVTKNYIGGPSRLALTIIKPGAGNLLLDANRLGGSRGSNWSGVDYHGSVVLTPASFLGITTGGSPVVVADHELISYATAEHYAEPAYFVDTGEGADGVDDCRMIHIAGKIVSSADAFNPPLRLNFQRQDSACKVTTSAHWDASLPSNRAGFLASQSDPIESGPARVVFGLDGSQVKIANSAAAQPWPHSVTEGKRTGWRALTRVAGDEVLSAFHSGTTPVVANPVPDDHCAGSACVIDSTVDTDAGGHMTALSLTDAAVDFSAAGVQAGDFVVILGSGTSAGQLYGVTGVSGASSETLDLDISGSGFANGPDSDVTGEPYKVVRPRCWDWYGESWVACGSPGSPDEATAFRMGDGANFWTFHRHEVRIIAAGAGLAAAECAPVWLRNGSDSVGDGYNANEYEPELIGGDGLDEAGETFRAQIGGGFDASDGDYLQLAILEGLGSGANGSGGNCLDGSDLGDFEIRGRVFEELSRVIP